MEGIKVIDINRKSRWEILAEEQNRKEHGKIKERKQRTVDSIIYFMCSTPFLFFLYWLVFGY